MTANKMIYISVRNSLKEPEKMRVRCSGMDELRITFKKPDGRNNNGLVIYDATLAWLAKYIAKHNLGNYEVRALDSRGMDWPIIGGQTLLFYASEVVIG